MFWPAYHSLLNAQVMSLLLTMYLTLPYLWDGQLLRCLAPRPNLYGPMPSP